MTTVEMHFESFGEMFYYFFKKKLCPICGEKLEKHKEKEDNGFQIWNNAFGNITGGHLNTITITYYCNKCKQMRTLSEVYKMQKDEEF